MVNMMNDDTFFLDDQNNNADFVTISLFPDLEHDDYHHQIINKLDFYLDDNFCADL